LRTAPSMSALTVVSQALDHCLTVRHFYLTGRQICLKTNMSYAV
jgi:hypothetical protein